MAQTTRSRKATSPAPSKSSAAPRAKQANDVDSSPTKGAGKGPIKNTVKNAEKPSRAAGKGPKTQPSASDVGLVQPHKAAPKSKARTKPAVDGEVKPSPKATAKPSAKSPTKPNAKPAPAARPTKGKTPAKASAKPAAAEAAPAYEVRRSAIHGLGLFATRRIRAEERIGVYQGPRSRKIDTYVLWVEDENGKEYGIDGQNEMRYVNHSKSPNAAFEGEELWSLRRIEPGEEITHHYGEDWED